MRSERELKDKLFLYEALLGERGLSPLHLAIIRAQVQDLKWMLGEGEDLVVERETIRQEELGKKLKELGI